MRSSLSMSSSMPLRWHCRKALWRCAIGTGHGGDLRYAVTGWSSGALVLSADSGSPSGGYSRIEIARRAQCAPGADGDRSLGVSTRLLPAALIRRLPTCPAHPAEPDVHTMPCMPALPVTLVGANGADHRRPASVLLRWLSPVIQFQDIRHRSPASEQGHVVVASGTIDHPDRVGSLLRAHRV